MFIVQTNIYIVIVTFAQIDNERNLFRDKIESEQKSTTAVWVLSFFVYWKYLCKTCVYCGRAR